jgi:lysophospholipase L1-like esterase
MTSAPKEFRVGRVLAWLATLPVLVLGVGFVLHTSLDPTVFGRWSTGYALFLAGWWFAVVPLVHLLARWVFRTQVFTLPSGRTLTWRPSAKLLLVLLVGWGLAEGVESRIHRGLGRGAATELRSDQFHPYLQNVPVPGKRRLGVNRHGFRGADVARERGPDTLRVFVFGGSTAFCGPLPLDETPAERMRQRLAAARPDLAVEVQNAGADWHTTEHALIRLLTEVRAFRPDVVVAYHGVNDLVRSLTPDAYSVGPYRDDYGHYLGPASALVKRTSRWAFVRMRFGHCFSDVLCDQVRVRGPAGEGVEGFRSMFFAKSEEVEVADWPSLEPFRRNLLDFVTFARGARMEVVLGTQPALYRADLAPEEREVVWIPHAHQRAGTRPSVASMRAGLDRFDAVTREVAQATGAAFVDLAARVPRDLAHLYDDVHFTARGAAVVGEALADAVLPLAPPRKER